MENPSFIPPDKHQLRKEFLQRRQALSLIRQQKAAEQFVDFVASLPPTAQILSYVSFRSELSSSLVNQYLLTTTQQVILPQPTSTCSLSPLRITCSASLCKIHHPLHISPSYGESFPSELITHALIPALAFDRNHFRLGYGGGYYDRWLAENPRILTIGVGFREQSIDLLPTCSHDIPLHKIMLF